MLTADGKVLVLQVMVGGLYAELAAMQPNPKGWLAARAYDLSHRMAEASEGREGAEEADQLRDMLNGVFETAESDLARLQARRVSKT